jgi:ATP-dependent helicase/DNAse subunit B
MKKNFKVKSMDKEKAILENSHRGRNLAWPVDDLPEDINEGDSIVLTINKASHTEEEQNLLAKNILNEILDTGE